MNVKSPALLFLTLTACAAGDPLLDSAQRKLESIQNGQAKPGSIVRFTAAEVNAWAHVAVPEAVPEGIRNGRVEFAADTATGFALVDFLKMRQAKGRETNWLIAKLIEGERPLKVVLRVTSSRGQCTVTPTRVELSGQALTGSVLTSLINTFFKPLYPDAKIDEPFDLGYNVDHIAVDPGGISVSMKR